MSGLESSAVNFPWEILPCSAASNTLPDVPSSFLDQILSSQDPKPVLNGYDIQITVCGSMMML